MNKDLTTEKQNNKEYPKGSTVHHVLARSYFIYFLLLIIAVSLDIVYPISVFKDHLGEAFGFVVLVLSSALVFWAQHTSRNLDHGNITKDSFCKGPYCYTRTPTHWGLFLLMLSFGFIANAFFVILFTIFSFVVTKVFFVKKQEALLEQKYGVPYLEYKKSVKF